MNSQAVSKFFFWSITTNIRPKIHQFKLFLLLQTTIQNHDHFTENIRYDWRNAWRQAVQRALRMEIRFDTTSELNRSELRCQIATKKRLCKTVVQQHKVVDIWLTYFSWNVAKSNEQNNQWRWQKTMRMSKKHADFNLCSKSKRETICKISTR